MSAYVVEDQVINKIVSYLNTVATFGGHDYKYDIPSLKKAGYDLCEEADCERLAQNMFSLNCFSVNERYGDGQAAEFRPLDFEYRFKSPRPRIEVFKALECWQYQSCEGSAGDTPLYKLMEGVKVMMAVTIVHDLPEYEQAAY